ncbi:hypothetical protein ACJ41O_011085 [Fusarium nematophilum]
MTYFPFEIGRDVPGLPIYASRDLKVWKHIATPSTALTNSHWHPPRRGKHYIVCTNCQIVVDETVYSNFLLTTSDIWFNEWSDPIFFDFQGIYPSLFFDEETGRAYVQGSWREMHGHNLRCTIRQFEIDVEIGRALTDTRQIWEGYAGKEDVEGPHVYKKDGFYYLLAAECGTFEEHVISVARSTSIWGPYETARCNPILTAAGRPNDLIQNTSHGDLFQDQSGSCRWTGAISGAGLSLYKDEFRHVDIYLDVYASAIVTKAILPRGIDRASTILTETIVQRPRSITFKVVFDSKKFRFSYAVDDDCELWEDHGEVSGSAMSGWDFTGAIFGVFAESESGGLDLAAALGPLWILSQKVAN